MAPALTEPLSPTEKITTAVSAAASPGTRSSSRKVEAQHAKSGHNLTKKQTGKNKACNGVHQQIQAETSPSRSRRQRDTDKRNTPKSAGKSEQASAIKSSRSEVGGHRLRSTKIITSHAEPLKKNGQLGLGKASIENQSNNNRQNSVSDSKESVEKDNSTAQLLADLTNEAITADICLRNQLKDVNLVKVSEGNSSPLQQENVIVVLKSIGAESPTASERKESGALMEAQYNKLNEAPKVSHNKDSVFASESSGVSAPVEINADQNEENEFRGEPVQPGRVDSESSANMEIDTISTNETSLFESKSELESKKTSTGSAHSVYHPDVPELPPVSTDSTMTASEVEDNLEERLSQLDGTAIESPPSHHDEEMDTTIKHVSDRNVTASLPRTSVRTPASSKDLQQIQQLESSPSTPVSQQSQLNHLQQQQNCFTPQFIKDSEGGGDLEDQDIEEVFKVLKGFEGGTNSDLNVCDLNVLFNEVCMKINETEVSNAQSHAPAVQIVKPTDLEEDRMDIEKRQQQMQRKIDFLLRRLRKQQSRYMCKHVSEEIAGLFEWSARLSSNHSSNNPVSTNGAVRCGAEAPADSSNYFLKVIASRPPGTDWKPQREIPVPASQVTSFLRKLESVSNSQQLCLTPTNNHSNSVTSKKARKSTLESQNSTIASSNTSMAEGVLVPTFDENVTDEMFQVAGLLQNEMYEVQRAIDSDATESSSGGESADEMVTYNNTQQQSLPITKRAAWRYSRDRAAIASRWSWLLSQISDLEIKIRQYSELHQDIVRSKGLVSGHSENSSKSELANTTDQDNEEHSDCSRTRGYISAQFRKRKLIQTANIHSIIKKAARPSTIKCGCQPPSLPCALCTSRPDPTAPRDLPDTMMMADRIALLDPGYHPVLSFRENVNNALHFEAIAKLSDWQHRIMRCQAKNIAKSVWKAEREAVAAAGGGYVSSAKKIGDPAATKRRYTKKKDRALNEEKSIVVDTSNSSNAKTEAGTKKSGLTPLIDAGSESAIMSTSFTTPLVANSNLLDGSQKSQEGPERRNNEGAHYNSAAKSFKQIEFANSYDDGNSSNERLSPPKLRSIQSQPNTFIIDLQQSQQQKF